MRREEKYHTNSIQQTKQKRKGVKAVLSEYQRLTKAVRNQIIYPTILQYMLDRKLSILDFARMCDVSDSALRCFLCGANNGSKVMVDQILMATGLKYEDAFARKDGA